MPRDLLQGLPAPQVCAAAWPSAALFSRKGWVGLRPGHLTAKAAGSIAGMWEINGMQQRTRWVSSRLKAIRVRRKEMAGGALWAARCQA